MPTVVGVRLRFSKTLWFDPAGSEPVEGDLVVVETDRGTELGRVVQPPHEVAASALPAPLKPVVRVADEDDMVRVAELEEKESEALPIFRQIVEAHKLDMKPIDVEYLLGGDKIVFYFSAEERVDFREVVKELATRFHARIDMRQVGVRDEARAVGGIGHCGQMLCCVRFGGEFQPVSIRMAKEQDLPLNPLKISGLCGRLMCCLRYEYDAYKDFKGRAPKRGAIIETPVGLAKVSDHNTPREVIGMRLEDGTSLKVPLASMECCKGAGCPCSIGQEALEAAGGAPAVAVADTMSEPAPAREPRQQRDARKRGPKPPQGGAGADSGGAGASSGAAPSTSGRKRRRRSGSKTAEGSAAPKPAEQQPKAAPKPPAEKPAGDGGSEAAKVPRRRRRRRGGGGGTKAS